MQIARSLVHELRAIFRRLVRKHSGPGTPIVSFETSKDGLHVRLYNHDVAAEYHQPSSLPTAALAIPLDALADFEGRKDDMVSLERFEPCMVRVNWQDAFVPQVKEYEAIDQSKFSEWPNLPKNMASADPGFLKALADATESGGQHIRYVLDKIQLRGDTGEIVATDGRQLLIQGGFHFGWSDDVLIPGSPVFASRELSRYESLQIGKTATHVVLQVGPWTFHLPVDDEGRFPKIDEVIPPLNQATRCQIDPVDVDFLVKSLSKLPGKDEDNAPITLDLNHPWAMLRVREQGQERITEMHLDKSTVQGKPVRISINRDLLARGLELGLQEVCVVDGDRPLVFRDDRRKFVIMPLGKEGIVLPGNATTISSVTGSVADMRPRKEMAEALTASTRGKNETNGFGKNGHAKATRNGKPNVDSLGDLVSEAEALKDELRKVYTRTHQLLTAAKKHRRQSKLVQSTLATLRQLKTVNS